MAKAIYGINLYPVDSLERVFNSYLLDSFTRTSIKKIWAWYNKLCYKEKNKNKTKKLWQLRYEVRINESLIANKNKSQ